LKKRGYLLCVFVYVLVSGDAFAQTAGKIISLQGRAEVRKIAAAPWLPAVNQQTLDNGESIRTLAQSRAVVLLADETH